MKRIESKRPALLGRIQRRNPDAGGVANFTPVVEKSIITRAEARAVHDGFPYFRDLILVLMALYGNGAMSPKLRIELPNMIQAWTRRENPDGRHLVKRNLKLRKDVYETALERWRKDSDGLTATAMLAFLLETYADGQIEFALRLGSASE